MKKINKSQLRKVIRNMIQEEFLNESKSDITNLPEKEQLQIMAQYEAIRRSGKTNMFAKNAVQRIAYNNHMYELVNLITDGGYASVLKNYGKLIKQIKDKDIPSVR